MLKKKTVLESIFNMNYAPESDNKTKSDLTMYKAYSESGNNRNQGSRNTRSSKILNNGSLNHHSRNNLSGNLMV